MHQARQARHGLVVHVQVDAGVLVGDFAHGISDHVNSVPGLVQEWLPDLVAGVNKFEFQHRVVFRLGGPRRQMHARFDGRPVAFPRIARQTARDHVFPARFATAAARRHVVETQFVVRVRLAAVLTTVAVAGKERPAVQADCLPRRLIEPQQADDPRRLDAEANGANPIGVMAAGRRRRLVEADLAEVDGLVSPAGVATYGGSFPDPLHKKDAIRAPASR